MRAIRAFFLVALTGALVGEGRASDHQQGGSPTSIPAAVSNGYTYYGPPYYVTVGPDGPVILTPVWPRVRPIFVYRPLPLIAAPIPVPQPRPVARVAPRRIDHAKAVQLVTIGDRLFRVGNYKRASERYEQAVRADPDAAPPRVRLAQVALVRGRYDESAAQLRQALAAEPGWLARAPNIEAVYAEPADFRRQISRLESRVLAEPGDRDAWLVLGAELFLSGQTHRAADIFLRLTDRKPDPALAAFLDAATPATAPER